MAAVKARGNRFNCCIEDRFAPLFEFHAHEGEQPDTRTIRGRAPESGAPVGCRSVSEALEGLQTVARLFAAASSRGALWPPASFQSYPS